MATTPDGHTSETVRPTHLSRVVLCVGLAALAAAVVIFIHPFDRSRIFGLVVSAREPSRALLVGALAILILIVIEPRTVIAWLDRVVAFARAHHLALAWAGALTVTLFGLAFGAFVAGGADSYGYVSEARLWLAGQLHLPQPAMTMAPWRDAQWSFTPLGYRPAPDGMGIVPVHAPGLPMLMAVAQWIAGARAVFCLVPLSGGLLVMSTYVIGRRLGRPLVGLAAAALVATSPTVLFMLVNPMSDLPTSAAWTLAVACLVGATRRGAAAAGLASAAAIAIRPNLIWLAVPCGAWTMWRDWRESRPIARAETPWYAVTAGLGVLCVAAVNRELYGSPFVSGYGALDYAWAHFIPNVKDYVAWIGEAESPALAAGLVCLVLSWWPLRFWTKVWTTPRERAASWFFLWAVVAVWGPFLFYEVHDVWWYLRYFLPTWPMAMLATAALIAALYRSRGGGARLAAAGTLAFCCWHGAREAEWHGVYGVADNEQRYIDAARLVSTMTPPDAVVLAVQHSGSLRYYAGRLTIRWDMIEPASLDAAIEWFSAQGHHPYLLLDAFERDKMRRDYGAAGEVGRLSWAPLAALDGDAPVQLFDAVNRSGEVRTIVTPRSRGVSGFRQFAPAVDVPALIWHQAKSQHEE